MKSPFSLTGKYNSLVLTIVVALALTGIISLLLIVPAWNHLKALGTEIPKAQGARDQVKVDSRNLQSARDFFKNNQNSVEKVNTAVPIDPSVPQILVTLDSLSKSTGVSLTSFTPQQVNTGSGATAGAGAGGAGGAAPSSGSTSGAGSSGGAAGSSGGAGGSQNGANTVEITANYSGCYDSLITFFYSLERSLRIVDVKTLSFAGENKSGGGSAASTAATDAGACKLTGTITFRAYYKGVEKSGAPAAKSPAVPGAPK